MLRGETVVIPLQNGVEAYDELGAALGPEQVLGGMRWNGTVFLRVPAQLIGRGEFFV